MLRTIPRLTLGNTLGIVAQSGQFWASLYQFSPLESHKSSYQLSILPRPATFRAWVVSLAVRRFCGGGGVF